jgi:hypothetical protein
VIQPTRDAVGPGVDGCPISKVTLWKKPAADHAFDEAEIAAIYRAAIECAGEGRPDGRGYGVGRSSRIHR